jgi:hypothetical protein
MSGDNLDHEAKNYKRKSFSSRLGVGHRLKMGTGTSKLGASPYFETVANLPSLSRSRQLETGFHK